MKRFVLFAAFGFGLAACSGGTEAPDVVMKNNTGEITAPSRGNYDHVAIRSFRAGPEGEWQEISGASCQVVSGAYRASLVTPADVRIPDLGPDAGALKATCTMGTLSGSDTVNPDFNWQSDEKPNAARRIGYGAGWWFGYKKSGPMKYPDLAVAMVPSTR